MMNVLATFGNLMSPEILIVGLIVLLLFGAKKLPELARGLGQSLNEFKRAREEFTSELTTSAHEPSIQEAKDRQARGGVPTAEELQRQVEELQRQLQAAQMRQQTPQLVGSTAPIAADVVEEPVSPTHL